MEDRYRVIQSKDLELPNAREEYEKEIASMEKEGWKKIGPELNVGNCLYQTIERI